MRSRTLRPLAALLDPMQRRMLRAALMLPMLLWIGYADQSQPLSPEASLAAAVPRVVQVAPPTGNVDLDRASIQAALDEVQPGGTVQFAEGTYVIGFNVPRSFSFIDVTVPRVTLLGHPGGTTLRGCDPEELAATGFPFIGCNGLELTGGHQTVRNVTFEHFWFSLVVGGLEIRCAAPPNIGCVFDPIERLTGGYLVEDNTFRNSRLIRVRGNWPEPAVIRRNRFVNVYHAVTINGRTVHVLDNEISAPDPALIPIAGHPGVAIGSGAASAILAPSCDNNVIAGNRIEGHPEAIGVGLAPPAESCRYIVIRDNIIVNSRIPDPQNVFLTSGVAISVLNRTGQEGLVEGTLIKGNRVTDSDGLAIEVFRASRNRIANNTIIGVTLRDPSLGITDRGHFPQVVANGSAIWVSPGSDENQILANIFADLASDAAVVLEGDRNHVATTNAGDVVRDLGIDNRVTGPGSVANLAAATRAGVVAASRSTGALEGAASRLRQRLGVGEISDWLLDLPRRQGAPPR